MQPLTFFRHAALSSMSPCRRPVRGDRGHGSGPGRGRGVHFRLTGFFQLRPTCWTAPFGRPASATAWIRTAPGSSRACVARPRRGTREILVRAAFEYYVLRRPELAPLYSASPRAAQALADLAVTGQQAYATFRGLAPTEAALVGPLATAPAVDLPRRLARPERPRRRGPPGTAPVVSGGLGASRADALPEHPSRGLGWIAVEGEDDPPHRPVNIPATPYPQYNLTVRVRGIDVTTRHMVASRDITTITRSTSKRSRPTGSAPDHRRRRVFIHGHSLVRGGGGHAGGSAARPGGGI